MAVTCYYSGRLGNCVYALAHLIAYAKKYDLPYYVPTEAKAYNHFRNGDISVPFTIPSTGQKPVNAMRYDEPHNKGQHQPYYHEIPIMDNVIFYGYYQSFKYFDWCTDYVLDTLNFPYKMEAGITGIHVRRGDCLNSPQNFPIAPPAYYKNAVHHMQARGCNRFRLYSDDISYCKQEFTTDAYNGAEFEFSEGRSEMEDYLSLSNCAHQITARSTFSLTAAWLNQNPRRIVCVPTLKHMWWKSQNLDLVPTYFTQIDFTNE